MEAYELWQKAVKAREFSYSPYSGFKVGAALLCKNGEVVQGCNVENSVYGPSNCAERTAFFAAVAKGQREFEAIAIAGGKEELVMCYPCGVCRQVMAEFCDPDNFHVICGMNKEKLEILTLRELLPKSFEMQD